MSRLHLLINLNNILTLFNSIHNYFIHYFFFNYKERPKSRKNTKLNKNLFFFCGRGLNSKPYIYYVLFMPTKLNSREQTKQKSK